MTENTVSQGPHLSLRTDPTLFANLDFKEVRREGFFITVEGYSPFFSKLAHTETIADALHSARSLTNAAIRRRIPRYLEVPAKLIPALYSSYLTHEMAGHAYFAANDKIGNDPPMEDLLAQSAGLNATMRGAEMLLEYPYEGVSSDLVMIAMKLDLPFYLLAGEWIQDAWEIDKDEVQKYKNHGDTEEYVIRRKDLSGMDDTWRVRALALWQSLGLFLPWPGPMVRAIKYTATGKESENPYTSGRWAFTTTGALSPAGPIYGIGARYFFEGNTLFPSDLSWEAWSSFGKDAKATLPAYGYRVGTQRLPLPFQIGALRFAASAHFIFSEMDVGNFDPRDTIGPNDRITTAGDLGLHLQGKRMEVSLEGKCKQKGFLPGELLEKGCLTLIGVQTSF